jgi:hypothetical protein
MELRKQGACHGMFVSYRQIQQIKTISDTLDAGIDLRRKTILVPMEHIVQENTLAHTNTACRNPLGSDVA